MPQHANQSWDKSDKLNLKQDKLMVPLHIASLQIAGVCVSVLAAPCLFFFSEVSFLSEHQWTVTMDQSDLQFALF